MLQIYNTLTQTKERFKPLRQELVKVYYCGPTPYDYAHIGNLRAYLFSDTVVRTLRYLGYPVQTVMNVTDIDDKTIRDSQKSGKSLQEFTEFFTEAFFTDLGRLHIQRADTVAPISTLIDDMVVMIQWLIDKGYAYLADDGSIYYRVDKFKTYGQLAHLDMKGMKAGARVNSDEYEKESVADFALWKAYDQEVDGPNKWDAHFIVPTSQTGQISHEGWETEWGVRIMYSEWVSQDWMGNMPVSDVVVPGRPGWHIECSACNMRYFGPQIDIHMGAIDNLFPHHQNEVAQTEAYTGKKFAGYWMHGGHLLVDNAKMSKSKKNFYTLSEIVEKVPTEKPDMVYRAFRLMTLQTQYRENFNFTFDRLAAAIQT
ncbi:MAG: Cysteinyl-tRNA synthetase, partial [uncultured bacterium (gcode 4)]